MLHTLDEHRRHGFAAMVVRHLSRQFIQVQLILPPLTARAALPCGTLGAQCRGIVVTIHLDHSA
jgi:hypothetical protein